MKAHIDILIHEEGWQTMISNFNRYLWWSLIVSGISFETCFEIRIPVETETSCCIALIRSRSVFTPIASAHRVKYDSIIHVTYTSQSSEIFNRRIKDCWRIKESHQYLRRGRFADITQSYKWIIIKLSEPLDKHFAERLKKVRNESRLRENIKSPVVSHVRAINLRYKARAIWFLCMADTDVTIPVKSRICQSLKNNAFRISRIYVSYTIG